MTVIMVALIMTFIPMKTFIVHLPVLNETESIVPGEH